MRIFSCVVWAASCGFAGCASLTDITNAGVVYVGAGTFMVTRQAPDGSSGLETLTADATADATRFCTRKGKDIQILSAMEQPPPLRNYLLVEVQFRCPAAAPAASHP